MAVTVLVEVSVGLTDFPSLVSLVLCASTATRRKEVLAADDRLGRLLATSGGEDGELLVVLVCAFVSVEYLTPTLNFTEFAVHFGANRQSLIANLLDLHWVGEILIDSALKSHIFTGCRRDTDISELQTGR